MLKLKDEIINQFGASTIIASQEDGLYSFLKIASNDLIKVCRFLYENNHCYFDYLSCITGLDLIDEGEIELIYDLVSIPLEQKITLKVKIDRNNPVIETVSSIWKSADWHERETYDLLGVQFDRHPDLRRILLPTNWEGFPLRKDYKESEKYHGVKIKY